MRIRTCHQAAQLALTLLFFIAAFFCCPAYGQDTFSVCRLQDAAAPLLPIVKSLPEHFRASTNAFFWTYRGELAANTSLTLEDVQGGIQVRSESRILPPPLSASVLMIDNSISMKPGWEQAKEALTEVHALLPRNTAVGVYSFSEQATAIEPLAPARPAGASRAPDMSKLALSGKNTFLYSALKEIIDQLAAMPVLLRSIIIFSDGGAEDTLHTLEGTTRQARDAGVVIHAVEFPGTTVLKAEAKLVLQQLSAGTGGRFILYKSLGSIQEALRTFPAISAGVIRLDDVQSLPFGQSRLKLTLLQVATNGQTDRHEQFVPIEGTQTFDNVMVTISRAIGGRDPKQFSVFLAGAVIVLFLLVMCIRRKMATRAKAEQLKQGQEIRKIQEEQKGRLEDIAQKLEQALNESDNKKHQPQKAYGWLVTEGGAVYDLTKRSTCIGRAPENDVILPDEYVSNEHAILDFKKGSFVWSDRSPKNPTRINGEKVSGSKTIEPGDAIMCGKTTLRFNLDMSS